MDMIWWAGNIKPAQEQIKEGQFTAYRKLHNVWVQLNNLLRCCSDKQQTNDLNL